MGLSSLAQKNRLLNLLLFFIACCGLGFFSSCLKDDNIVNGPNATTESPISALSVIHGSPDAPTFDFVLNGEPVFPSRRTFTKRIPYFPLYPGNYEARFYTHNTYSNAFYRTNVKLAAGKYHSLFLTGLKADSLTTLFTEDKLSRPKEGKTKLRFLNLSPDAGALDFAIVQDSLFAIKQNFKDYTPFHEIEAGDYSANFKSSEGKSVHYDFKLKLEKGKIYTVWAQGLIETTNEDQAFGSGLIVHDLNW